MRELMLGSGATRISPRRSRESARTSSPRLRDLESAGVVRKTKLPPPWAVSVYELTDDGRALDGCCARWPRGARARSACPRPATAGACTPSTCGSGPSTRSTALRDPLRGRRRFSLAVKDGKLDAIRGELREPTLVVEAEPTRFHALIEGRDDPERAVAEGRVGWRRLGDRCPRVPPHVCARRGADSALQLRLRRPKTRGLPKETQRARVR